MLAATDDDEQSIVNFGGAESESPRAIEVETWDKPQPIRCSIEPIENVKIINSDEASPGHSDEANLFSKLQPNADCNGSNSKSFHQL